MSDSFNSSLCYEQVTITPTAIVKESTEYGELSVTTMDATTWGFPLLSQEGADKIIIRRFSFLTGDEPLNKKAVAIELKDLGITHAHPTDKGFITYTLFDGDDARKFGDLRTIVINNISEKMFKRLSLLNVMSYAHATFDRDSVKIEFVEGVCGPHVDGEVYISKAMRRRVAKAMYYRIAAVDPAKALRLFKQVVTAATFNTGRALVFDGLIKGDFVVARDEKMNGADILVHVDDNLKTEVRHADEDGFIITMMPNKQDKSVRTNRQVLSLIGEDLLGRDLYLAVDFFKERTEAHLERIATGQFVPKFRETPEVDGAIDGIIDKAHVWYETFGTLANSRYLTSMVAGQFVNQNTPRPDEDDRKRRFPVPFARSYSMRSEHSYEMAYGRPCPVKPGHVLLDKKLGAIVANDILVEAFGIAGGADLDDKWNMHFRIIDGEVRAIIIRDPMTADVDADGETLGLEYQIRPVHGYSVDVNRGTLHGEFVPVWDVENFPLTVAEIEAPAESLTATPRKFPGAYTPAYAWEVIQENVKDSFGGFANLLMAYVNLGISFPFVAKGETLIDICQQSRNPQDLQAIAHYVGRLRTDLVRQIIKHDLVIDRYIAKRAGIIKMLHSRYLIGDGLFGAAIDNHKEIVAEFKSGADDLVREITSDIRIPNSELTTLRAGGQTMFTGEWLAMKLRQSLQGTELTTNPKTEAERNLVGNHMAAFLLSKVEEGQLTRSAVLELVRQMFLWAHRQTVDMDLLPEDAVEVIEFPEKTLYYGEMFRLLVEALEDGPLGFSTADGGFDPEPEGDFDLSGFEPEFWELDGQDYSF